MRRHTDITLTDHFVVTARLKEAIKEIERDVAFLRLSLLLCAGGLCLAALKFAHHMFDLPTLTFIWELIVSICT